MITQAFYAARVPTCLIDLNARILEMNEAFCKLVRKRADTLRGTSHDDLIVHDSSKATSLEKRLNATNDWSSLRCYQCGDTQTWVELHFSALRDKESHLIGAVVQALDVSEQCKLKRDIEDRQKELEQFVYISSHDLREPCNSMAGLATLLKRRYGEVLDETGNRWLDEIVNIAKQANKKIDALLELSRAGREILEGRFALGSAVEEAVRALSAAVKRSGAIIEVDVSGGNPTFRGDRSMIAQVFQNLLSNAIKYSKVTPRIVVKTSPYENDLWCISVTDNGLGFDMKFKDRIFGVFQRLYTIAQYPGTGMGLAIAKKIVERHHGSIWVESEPGKGTSFFFTLPTIAT